MHLIIWNTKQILRNMQRFSNIQHLENVQTINLSNWREVSLVDILITVSPLVVENLCRGECLAHLIPPGSCVFCEEALIYY